MSARLEIAWSELEVDTETHGYSGICPRCNLGCSPMCGDFCKTDAAVAHDVHRAASRAKHKWPADFDDFDKSEKLEFENAMHMQDPDLVDLEVVVALGDPLELFARVFHTKSA